MARELHLTTPTSGGVLPALQVKSPVSKHSRRYVKDAKGGHGIPFDISGIMST